MTGQGPPVDAAARARLLDEHDRTFFVEAGAGTGKTTVLVGRVVSLVRAGRLDMPSLAAITFTEAAAAELRDRVRAGLEQAAAGTEYGEEERRRCRAAAAEVDLAQISTIHAFAASLLRSYPLEAGLPPGLAPLDEIEQGARFEERFRAWFWGDALRPPTSDVVRRALLLGMTQDQVRDLAVALEGHYDLLMPTTGWPCAAPEDAVMAAHAVGAALAEADGYLGYARIGPGDPLALVVTRARAWGDRLRGCATEEKAIAALCGLGTIKSPGRQSDWGKLPDGTNACKAIKDILKEVNERAALVLAGHRAAALSGVLGALRDFTLAGVSDRRADGVATFQDLLAWARDLLRDHAEVRRRAQARYLRIFVDEFQDTDPLQAEIVFYLCADPDAALPGDWRDISPVPGKLFVVGDPKQSIYRFRRADIGLYDALQARLADGRVYLVQNFRSVPPVLAWVNHHFGGQMTPSPRVQPAYVDLHPQRGPLDPGRPRGVYRIGTAVGGNAPAVAAAEAAALAETIHSVVEDGWPVLGRAGDGTPGVRAAGYGDICILIRARTHLRTLERALEDCGVPYRVESGSLLLATQEVRDLLAGLRAIDDPSDQVALVGALRSPAFACSDPDLLRWVEGGGRLDYEEPGDGPDGQVKRALACLAEFHARRHLLAPPALIEAYIGERLLAASAFGDVRPRESWRRLRYVSARARQLAASGRHSLRAFLDWIDGLERAEARDVESAEAEPDEAAVRILTVHKAKGLEFPVVLLAGLGSGRGGGNDAVEVIADRATDALACRVGKEWQTDGFEAAQAHETRLADAELVRLLYVAATRARDHLVLSLFRTAGATTSPAALIEGCLDGTTGLCHPLTVTRDGSVVSAAVDTKVHDGHPVVWWGGEDDERAWLIERRALVGRLGTEPRVSDDGTAWLADEGESPGREGYDVAGPVPFAHQVRALIRGSDPDRLRPSGDEHPDVLAVAGAIVGSEAFKEAVANPTCRRAVPLLAVVDGVVLDVTVDLMYETAGEVTLVAYDIMSYAGGGEERGLSAARLAHAYEQATDNKAAAVDVISGVDGLCRRFLTREPPAARLR